MATLRVTDRILSALTFILFVVIVVAVLDGWWLR
jgi:hypothetical protein